MNQNPDPLFSETEDKPERSPAEWVTFGIALAVLATTAGLVVYDWLTMKQEPPVIALTRSEPIRQAEGQFYIPFEVKNSGGETVESVQIIAELKVNGQVAETGEQQIDFLSAGETAEGAFIFTRNPQSGELMLRAASYKLP